MDGSQLLDRGLRLLAAVVEDDGVTPAAKIAATLGLSSSTARRILAVLEKHDMVRRIAHGHYTGGSRLTALSAIISPYRKLILQAQPLLRRLARRAGAIGHLGVLENEMVTYLIKESAPSKDIFTREEAQLEAYCTGIGKALLAQMPFDELDRYLQYPFVPLTPYTLTDPQDLRREIDAIRRRGYAIDNREIDENLVCIAVPVHLPDGMRAAISLAGRPSSFPLDDADRIAKRLARTASAIADRMEQRMFRS